MASFGLPLLKVSALTRSDAHLLADLYRVPHKEPKNAFDSRLWEQKDGGEAWWIPGECCAKAKVTGVWQRHAMAKTLLRPPRGALSDYQARLTSERMEGINRKIRGLLASASGVPSPDFSKLRLYALHEAKRKMSAKTELSRYSSIIE